MAKITYTDKNASADPSEPEKNWRAADANEVKKSVNDLYDIVEEIPSNFLGLYTSLGALESAHATASSGNWAIVDPGSGTDAVKYLWDEDEGWVQGGGGGAGTWGSITGTLSDQTDLQAKFDRLPNLFNVEDYGAVHDGVTDDTTAIQDTINACYAAGGGVIYFPIGVYIIGGALITSLDGVNPNCQLYIPLHNKLTHHSTIPVMHFKGEVAPAPFGTILNNTGGVEPPTTGVILKSTITGSGTDPRVIGSSYYNTGFTNTNSQAVIFENIRIRVKSKSDAVTHIAPTVGAFGAKYIEVCEFRNCVADTETNTWNSVEPTSSGVVGFDCPQISNRGNSRIYRCLAKNFYTGFNITEHIYADDLEINSCLYGYKFVTNAHPFLCGKLLANGYRYAFVFDGAPRGRILQAVCERFTATKWYAGTAELYAPSSLTTDADVEIFIHVLQSGANTSVQPVGSGTFGGHIKLHDLSNFTRFFNSTGLSANADYPVDQLRYQWTAVSNDTYYPTRTYVHKQSGTSNVVGQEIWVNEQASTADKRLGMIEVKTNGSADTGIMNVYVGNGGLLKTWELRPSRSVSFFPIQLPSYTVATVPAANIGAGHMIYVSNESGGAVMAFSDGTNWRRVTDREIIS